MKGSSVLWEPRTPPGAMKIGATRTVSKCIDGVRNRRVSGGSGTYVPERQDRSFVRAVPMSDELTSRWVTMRISLPSLPRA